MTNLITVADAAYPFDLSELAHYHVSAVAGYVGGDTPHVWSIPEVQSVILGMEWWPIWTAPSTGQRLTAAMGTADGKAMCAILPRYSLGYSHPVLLDIEYSTWHADPTGARAYLNAWKSVMHAANYANAIGYLPWSAQFDWVANWIGSAPTELPDNVIGWQYASDGQLNRPFDLSVFDTDKLSTGVVSMTLTPAEQRQIDHIENLVALTNAGMVNIGPAIAEMRGEDQVIFRAVAQSAANEAGLLAAIQQLGKGAPIDVAAIQQAAQDGATAALQGYSLSLNPPKE